MPKQNKLMQLLHNRLRLTLVDGRVMVGQLIAYDKHLNLVLADTEELRTARKGTEMKRTLGLIVLRGEHVVTMTSEGAPSANKTRIPASNIIGRAVGVGAVPPPGVPLAAGVPLGMAPHQVPGVMPIPPPQ